MKQAIIFLFVLISSTLSINAQYCESFNLNNPNRYITNLTFEGENEDKNIDNTTLHEGHFNYYSGISAEVNIGKTYEGSINYFIPAYNAHQLKIWIDYDGDETFDNDEEIASYSGAQPATDYSQNFSFTIPDDGSVMPGTTRLRAMVVQQNIGPCTTAYTAGEVEDYNIIIRPDPIAPTAVCQNLTLDLDIFGDAVITANDINDGSSDDYDAPEDLIYSIDQTEFDCDNLGNNTVTLTVTDLDGLSNTCTATVTIETYKGAFTSPPLDDVNAYCGYTVATPVLDYQCLTTIIGTTDDLTTFDTDGVYNITWSFFNGGVTETSSQTITITTPTTPTALTTSNIDEEDVDLSWTSSEDGPFKVRYKETTESTWNVIKNITDTNISLSDLKNNIQYDVQVAVDADCASYTSTVNFTTLGFDYCIPLAINNNSNYYISAIDINDLVATYGGTDNRTYAYVEDVSAVIALGENLTGDITFNKAEYQNAIFRVWIDLNVDGDYDDEGEDVYEGSSTTKPLLAVQETISILIPTTATTGKTRMRISSSVKTPTSSCSFDNDAGEVLEFQLEIRSNATPPTAVCQDLNVQLDISGNATITASQIDDGSTDDFDKSEDLILTLDKTEFDCDDLGDNDVVFTVTDSDGLSSTCTATVNVSTYSGTFIAPTLETVNGYCSYTATTPVLNYQCGTLITATTTDPTTFTLNGTYSIDWSFDNGDTVVTSTQTINITTPTTPTSLSTANITETNVDISWTAVDPGPFIIRYKKTSDTTWTETTSISTTNITLSSLDTGTEYEVQVKVDADSPSCANYTSSVTFTTTAVTYCTNDIGLIDSNTNYISNVTIGNINQTSDNTEGFYTYYSGISNSLTPGGTLGSGTITYQRDASNISQFAIWIDFNKNGIFDNGSEKIYENTTAGSATTTVTETLSNITIPSSALTGSTRMRIALAINDSEITSACDFSNSNGDVEDYDIMMNEPVDVSTFYEAAIITQVYHSSTDERWIEISNNSTTEIPENTILLALYQNKTGDQTDITPDKEYTLTSSISANSSILIKSTSSSVSSTGTSISEDNITDFSGADDILIVTSVKGSTAWANRYDVISDIIDESSFVRNDNVTTYNNTYTATEWTPFLNNATVGIHPNAPIRNEIDSANNESNIELGNHNFGLTDRTSSDWSNGFPDKSRQVSISENYEHTGSNLTAKTLTITASNKLTMDSKALIVTDGITINTGSEIRLKGTSQLIQTHTTANQITGDGNIYIDQNSNLSSKYSFNYFSSPVVSAGTTYTIDDILKDGTTATSATSAATDINFVSGYDGNNTTPISIAEYWIYTYPSSLSSNNGYVQKKSTGTINQTDGFLLKGPGVAQNYTFVGTPNDGNITTTIGEDESYLIGNPYPSAISAKEFIEDNASSITGTLYFWQQISDASNHNYAGYVGGYATRNATMGTSADAVSTNNNEGNGTPTLGSGSYDVPAEYIAVGQAFFVNGDSDGGGTITFNNSQREYITEGSESIFFKKASKSNTTKNNKTSTTKNNTSIIKLGIDYKNDENLNLHRQLGISFSTGKTFDHENGYDSPLYNESETNVYWKFPNNDEKYVITGVQEISDDLEIPLEIVMGYDGDLSFNIDEWENVNQNVYLKDKTDNTTKQINGKSAIVNLTQNTYTDRFYLTFKSETTLNNNDIINNQINISYNNELNHILIHNSEDINMEKVELYNIAGKQIKTWSKLNNNPDLVLSLDDIYQNIYIIKVYTKTGIVNRKLLLY